MNEHTVKGVMWTADYRELVCMICKEPVKRNPRTGVSVHVRKREA